MQKNDLYAIAQLSTDVKDSKALLAGKRIWGKVEEACLVPQTAIAWDWDTAYQNLCSARREFSYQPKSIAVVGDDGNVSEKICFLLVRSQTGKFVTWCPIQVEKWDAERAFK